MSNVEALASKYGREYVNAARYGYDSGMSASEAEKAIRSACIAKLSK